MRITFLIVLMWAYATQTVVYAQDDKCGTKSVDLNDPDVIAFNSMLKRHAGKTQMDTRKIPVAVHVIYSNPGTSDTLSDAQLNSQFSVLNSAYRGGNGGVDTHIEFCLAGVERIQSGLNANTFANNIAEAQLKALAQEDPFEYLNVWIVESITGSGGNVLGYSSFPKDINTASQLDGVVIANRYWGNEGTATNGAPYDLGMTAVHEIGHWLNLFHVFQGGCDDFWTCEFMGDCCCDTPPQIEEHNRCRTGKNTCHGDNPDEKDPVRNYMGWSNDDCFREFTTCQSGRMNMTLDSVRTVNWVREDWDCPILKRNDTYAVSSPFTCRVFPNPIEETGVLELDVREAGRFDVLVYDAKGKEVLVLSREGFYERGLHQLEIAGLSKGIFVVVVRFGDVYQSVRVVN